MSTERASISNKLRFEILARDGFSCKYCGGRAGEFVRLHIDHIIPVCQGGTNDRSNLAACCSNCNAGKSGKTIMEHARYASNFIPELDKIREAELIAKEEATNQAPPDRRPQIGLNAVYLTEEAAVLLGCRPSTIRHWVRVGRIAARGRPFRIIGSELLKMTGVTAP